MTFDSHDDGTPERAWRDSGFRERAAVLDIGAIRRLVVLAAHPDDETLAAGALMHAVAAAGGEVVVVVATSGEASHPDSPTWTRAALADVRDREVREAVTELAPGAEAVLLGLPDSGLASALPALAEGVRRVVRAGDTLVSTWRHDRHADHEALAGVAEQVAAEVGAMLFEAPIWAFHWGEPASDWPSAVRFVPSPEDAAAKAAALARHATQVLPLSGAPGDEVLLRPAMLDHFTGDELFFPVATVPTDFDAMYRGSDDPWGFEDRWYEQRKRALTLAALPAQRYTSALELGCSIGVTTAALADRADAVLAVDVAARAVELARARLADRANVRVEQRRVPDDWPDGAFDLVVLSETGFYFTRGELERLGDRIAGSLAPGGTVLLCHWRPHVAGLEVAGDEVHALLVERLGFTVTVGHVEDDFRLDVLQAPPARSVAQVTGLR